MTDFNENIYEHLPQNEFDKSMESIDQLLFDSMLDSVFEKCNFLTDNERDLSIMETLYKHKEHNLYSLELAYQKQRMGCSDAYFRGNTNYIGESWIDNFYDSNKFNTKFVYKLQLFFFIFNLKKYKI
jgi:hypothetical protein